MNERIPTPAGHSIDQLPGGDLTKKGSIKPEECAKRYPEALHIARRVGLEMGYAVAVHGSQIRDLDLIAVPWTEGATPALEFVKALELALGGFIAERRSDNEMRPVVKPHGRRCWTIHLGAGPYVDLSIVPANGCE